MSYRTKKYFIHITTTMPTHRKYLKDIKPYSKIEKY